MYQIIIMHVGMGNHGPKHSKVGDRWPDKTNG
jgi:hypothetical protein